MSFLCSCTRKPRIDEDSFEYCYGNHRKLSEGAVNPAPTSAPTPRVKRKFPEGVGPPLPLVPSDLEDYVDKQSTDHKPYPLPEIKLTPANDENISNSQKENDLSTESDSESDIDEVERTLLSICEQEEAKLYGDRISHCSSTNARRDGSSTDRDLSSSSSITTASSLNLIQYDEDTDDDSSSDMFWGNDRDDSRSITSQELEDLLIGNGEEDDEESLLEWDRTYVEEENEILHQHTKPVIVKEWLKGELLNTELYKNDIPEKKFMEEEIKVVGNINTECVRSAVAEEENHADKHVDSAKEPTKEGIFLVLEENIPNKDRAPTDIVTDLIKENVVQEKTSETVPECTSMGEKVVTSCDRVGNDANEVHTKAKRRSSKRKDSSKRKKGDKVPLMSPNKEPSVSSEDSVREFKTGRFKVTTISSESQALDLAQNSNVQDAFVIAVEQQARERLERLSALKRIKPVDMTKLSQQSWTTQDGSASTLLHLMLPTYLPPKPPPLPPIPSLQENETLNQQIPATEHQQELNGFIESSPIYVTSIPTANNNSVAPQPQAVAVSVTPPRCTAANVPGRGVKVPPCNGHAVANTSSTEEPDSAAEIELKQDLSEDAAQKKKSGASGSVVSSGAVSEGAVVQSGVTSASSTRARASSPFANGRTEVLIGQESVESATTGKLRTTAIVETNNNNSARKLGVGEENLSRPRRRSGSSIVVVDTQAEEPVKQQQQPTQENEDAYNMMMMTMENGPHREMAVDVPDSFIARSKTPPRYPPPRLQQQNGSAAKPVPPPRDHLRIEKDGRLVNRAPAPQVPARTAIASPVPPTTNAVTSPVPQPESREPTKEQLDSIRKYQEALRKRKEEEERVAQQNEFLNRSLRGSRKLQALESHPAPSGVVNDGYSSAEEADTGDDTLHRIIGYGELVASLQRLQHQLKKSQGGGLGYTSLEGQIAAVQTLLLSAEFGRALAVHNKVQEVWNQHRHFSPISSHSQNLVRDCLETLQPCSLTDAAELTDLLTRYEFEGLLYAHDAIAAQEMAIKSPLSMASGSPPCEDERTEHYVGEDNIKIIKIEKTNEPLGATVRNEGDAVIIGRIVRGGAAEKSGLLHEGDEVLEVNGIEMRGKSVNDVCDILSGMTGTLTFLIVPESSSRPPPPPARDTLMHVKAHFDYDPEEDLYIPCRELGISFQKGDVLHVISQEDPNWWQAYREGEEDQTLAGLIPSRSFQHQRESMKQTIAGDKTTKEKTKKAGTLLCAKKNPKKKKKKLPYNVAYSDGSYPLYSTSTVDDYDTDEILTYEEVSLYYPRANHKRPIVLIGPPNIGRHELRQRLMEDSERFAAAIPHTSRSRKEGEVDGQDYHFITRAQFEADILARKFVEHGEYEKAYYGTSLDAIRSVVNSGKICVLNLHPQSLKILRSSDLKPYVVFVAPPSLEKLRQKKIRNGEAFKEDELKDIIEKAREMEDKYGHFFDMIIINNDTDRAYHQLLNEINSLEREPQWVPASWVKNT